MGWWMGVKQGSRHWTSLWDNRTSTKAVTWVKEGYKKLLPKKGKLVFNECDLIHGIHGVGESEQPLREKTTLSMEQRQSKRAVPQRGWAYSGSVPPKEAVRKVEREKHWDWAQRHIHKFQQIQYVFQLGYIYLITKYSCLLLLTAWSLSTSFWSPRQFLVSNQESKSCGGVKILQ